MRDVSTTGTLVQVRIDTSRIEKAIQEYAKTSSRGLAEILNRSAGSVMIGAFHATKKADRGKIRARVYDQYTVTKTITNKRKKTSRVVSTVKLRPSRMMYGYARNVTGLKGNRNPLLEKEARRLSASRARASGFLASGWLPALREFLGTMGGRKGIKSLTPGYNAEWATRFAPVGMGEDAKPYSDIPMATFAHLISAAIKYGGAVNAIRAAMDKEAQMLEKMVLNKALKDAAKTSGTESRLASQTKI